MRMNQCKNLDDFYDILFLVDGTLIKANSLVLRIRSPYFSAMLSPQNGFFETNMKKGQSIKVYGVEKSYFSCIIQYIYSDHFYIHRQNVEFFVKLLIFADYFMLPRLVDICSNYLKSFVNIKTVFTLLLVGNSHNADQLVNYCVHYIAMND
jgi:hypothetical protein